MSSYRQVISNLRTSYKMISSDNIATNRLIMNELRSRALYLIKQKIDGRLLFDSPNIFTYVPCLKMKQVPLAECCEYRSEKTISRSVERLPKIAEAKFGLLIQRVTGLEFATKYIQATPTRYTNLLNINPKTKEEFYWVLNGYLYITNPDLKMASISAYFEDEPSSLLLCPDGCDCGPRNADCDPCQNPLDREFKCPGDLLGTVEEMVAKYLMGTYFRVDEDPQSDDKDEQIAK